MRLTFFRTFGTKFVNKDVNKKKFDKSPTYFTFSFEMFGINTFVNLSRALNPSQAWSKTSSRSYVRNFWEKNNGSPFIHGHKRNEPWLGKFVSNKRNVS